MATSRRYPDPCRCKVRQLAHRLYFCHSDDVLACPYVIKCGWYQYCSHPDCPNFQNQESLEKGSD